MAYVKGDFEENKGKDSLNTPIIVHWKQQLLRTVYLITYLSTCYILDVIHWRYFPQTSGGNMGMNLATQKSLANIKKKYDRTTDVPFFWHVPKSGGTSIKNMYSQCYGMVEASESGAAHGQHKESFLNVVEVEKGRYVNVDVTTEDGIDRAASLRLVESNLADIIVSPLLYKSSSSLFTENRPGRVMSIFRHPIDRVISIFFYLQKATWEPTYNPLYINMTLREYAFSNFAESNFVARSLLNKMEGKLNKSDVRLCKQILSEKILIGMLDDLEKSVQRFDSFFGFSPVYATCRDMYLKKGVNRRDGGSINTQTTEYKVAYGELKRKNWLDIILYDYAKELYKKQGDYFENQV